MPFCYLYLSLSVWHCYHLPGDCPQSPYSRPCHKLQADFKMNTFGSRTHHCSTIVKCWCLWPSNSTSRHCLPNKNENIFQHKDFWWHVHRILSHNNPKQLLWVRHLGATQLGVLVQGLYWGCSQDVCIIPRPASKMAQSHGDWQRLQILAGCWQDIQLFDTWASDKATW